MAWIGTWAFGFDFLGSGVVSLAVFLLGCFLTALAVGLFVCTLVLLFGTRAETSAWAAVNFLVMLAGVYYPVSVLPDWVHALSALIPLTYLLDAFRARVRIPVEFAHPELNGLALALRLRRPRPLGARRGRHARARAAASCSSSRSDGAGVSPLRRPQRPRNFRTLSAMPAASRPCLA